LHISEGLCKKWIALEHYENYLSYIVPEEQRSLISKHLKMIAQRKLLSWWLFIKVIYIVLKELKINIIAFLLKEWSVSNEEKEWQI
jgi:hypothetical protein